VWVRDFLCFTLFTAVVSCGGSTDKASPESAARAFCKPDATGVELVVADLPNVGAIDANADSIALSIDPHPEPAYKRIISVSKATCMQSTLIGDATVIFGLTASDDRILWDIAGDFMYAHPPAWSPTRYGLSEFLGIQDWIYTSIFATDHDDEALAFLGIETTPSRSLLASLRTDRVDVLAELSEFGCAVADVARTSDGFLIAGGTSVPDAGARGCVLRSGAGGVQPLFETDQSVFSSVVVHGETAFLLAINGIWRLDLIDGRRVVFVDGPVEAIAAGADGLYWAGGGRVGHTPFSGGEARTLATAKASRWIAVDDEHVYWLERVSESYPVRHDLMRVAK
jgi:hypothetical protein